MADKLSKQHACQLWLDQEADKAIAAKEIYSVASKRITGEVNTHFEAAYKGRSIERRIRRRAEKANPKPKTVEKSTVGQVSHIPETSKVDPQPETPATVEKSNLTPLEKIQKLYEQIEKDYGTDNDMGEYEEFWNWIREISWDGSEEDLHPQENPPAPKAENELSYKEQVKNKVRVKMETLAAYMPIPLKSHVGLKRTVNFYKATSEEQEQIKIAIQELVDSGDLIDIPGKKKWTWKKMSK